MLPKWYKSDITYISCLQILASFLTDIIFVVKTLIALLIGGFVLTACGSSTPPTSSTPQTAAAPAAKPDEPAAQDWIKKVTEAEGTFFKQNRRYAIEFTE